MRGLPSAKSPLVAMTAQQASDVAVDRLQVLLPPLLPIGTGTVGGWGSDRGGANSHCAAVNRLASPTPPPGSVYFLPPPLAL